MMRLIALLLACSLGFAQVNPGVGNPYVNTSAPKTSYSGSISSAITTLGSVGTIATGPGTFTVGVNTTIPSGIRFAPAPGAVFTIPAGVTLTINGPFLAQPVQVFNCVSTGKVVFGSTSPVVEVYPQWWGAKGDCTSANGYVGTSATAAFQAAIDTLRPVKLIDGGYYIDGTLTLPDQTSHPYISTSLTGTLSNFNSAAQRGNCFIECDTPILFAPKTAFSGTCLSVRAKISNIGFYSHTSGNTLFANTYFNASVFENNWVVLFGQCFSMTGGPSYIRGNRFLAQCDSVMKGQSGNYSAETWWTNNYFSGNTAIADVVLFDVYGALSTHIVGNYFDFASVGVYVRNSSGRTEISGNSFDGHAQAIKLQSASETMISNNGFRHCRFADKATYGPNNTLASPWSCVAIVSNASNTTIVGNSWNLVDKFIYGASGAAGIWNFKESNNVGDGPAVDISVSTLLPSSYAKDGTNIWFGSRGGWAYPTPSSLRDISTDFLGGTAVEAPWVLAAVDSGTYAAQTSVATHEGILRFTSAASGSSGGSVLTGVTQVMQGQEASNFVFQVPTTTTNLLIRAGWANALSGSITDGVYAEIAGATLSGKSATASSIISTGSTYTISAGTWYLLQVIKSATNAATRATLYAMDGTVLWHDSVANTSTVAMQQGWYCANTAPSGATVIADLDYIGLSLNHTPARGK